MFLKFVEGHRTVIGSGHGIVDFQKMPAALSYGFVRDRWKCHIHPEVVVINSRNLLDLTDLINPIHYLHKQKEAIEDELYRFFLAGEEGFEPSIHAFKGHCLTTWPLPTVW